MNVYTLLHLVKIVILLVSSATSFCLLILSYTGNLYLIESTTTSNLVLTLGVFLLSTLLLLLIKDFVHMGKTLVKELITLIVSISISIYIVLGSLIDISRFRPCRFTYIPPMFIILEYQIEVTTIKSLVVSIPLGVAFITLIYSLYEFIRTYRTFRIKYLDEVINGVDLEHIHNVES